MPINEIYASFRSNLAMLWIVFLMTGCSSGLSKDECLTVDWQGIGYEDGVQGRHESRISEHRKVCASHGVAFELDAYRRGYENGISRYCKPANGYHLGRSGKRYTGVCPQLLEKEFIAAYQDGRAVYALEVRVQRTARMLRNKHKRLANIEIEIRDTGLELIAHGITVERRIILLDELRKLSDERVVIKSEIPYLEDELEDSKQQLENINTAQIM